MFYLMEIQGLMSQGTQVEYLFSLSSLVQFNSSNPINQVCTACNLMLILYYIGPVVPRKFIPLELYHSFSCYTHRHRSMLLGFYVLDQ